jgi:DNA-binding beta-propeller fold protein YncE
MGGSDRESEGCRADRATGGSRLRELRRLAAVACLAMLAAGALSPPALAAGSEARHAFSASASFTGEGACKFTEPGGVAVSDATGEVFVFDRATHSINRFSAAGACLTHKHIGPKEVVGEETNEGIAVDNAPSSPFFGQVYVVGAPTEEQHAVLRFKPEPESAGKFTLKPEAVYKKFKQEVGPGEFEVFEQFEEVHGLAVDSSGDLFVAEGETFIDKFAPSSSTLLASRTEVSGGACSPRPGFAATGNAENFYIGRFRENRKEECEETATVAMKLNAAGEPVSEVARNAQLDNENTTGIAVDRATGEVYFDNGTSVSAFDANGQFVQRFGNEGAGHLRTGTGIAIDSASETVFVADVGENGFGVVQAFGPSSGEEPRAKAEAQLPDNRAYELVSPQNKLGAALFPITLTQGVIQAAEDGHALAYVASAPTEPSPPSSRGPEPAPLLAHRGPGAWATEDIATPRSEVPDGYKAGNGTEYRAFSSDLSSGFVEPAVGIQTPEEQPLSSEAGETTVYRRALTTPSKSCEPVPSTCYQALVSPLSATSKEPFGAHVFFLSATPDGSHAVVQSDVPLISGDEGEGLYEWASGGTLQLISVLPEGEEGSEFRLGERGSQNGNMRHAISNNGQRMIFSTGGTEDSKLYLRDTATGETLRLDKASGVTEPAESGAVFQSANAAGTRVFFTDSHRLTANSTSEEVEGESEAEQDLYACDIVVEGGELACKLTNLTFEVKAANESAGVQGVPGVSEDGSTVYYVANGALSGGAGKGACVRRGLTEEGEEAEGLLPVLNCSLYTQHFDSGSGKWEAPKFIATLTTQDAHDWQPEPAHSLSEMTSRISPNGAFYTFMSNRSLTGYNNVDAQTAAKGARDEEVFLYSAGADRITCASCNPSGAQPKGVLDTEKSGEGIGLVSDAQQIWSGRWLAANVPGWTALSTERALYQSRYLSDTGRLFFNSADALVAADENGKADVYEFEVNGQGSCTSATGCVSLISSGTSSHESAFLDASASGNDAFIFTAEKLVKQDEDTAFDVYDARVCTSESPCLTPPPEPPAPCSGEACKEASASQPALPAVPPSATFSGPGNIPKHEVLTKNEETPKSTPKKLTRAQKLKKALKACKKIKSKHKRAACQRKAHKQFGPIKHKSTKAARGSKR